MPTPKRKAPPPKKAQPAKARIARKWKDGYVEVIGKMARLGMSRAEICMCLSISVDTLWEWERNQDGVSEALKGGSEIADERVARSLYERAVGYAYRAEKVFNHNGRIIRAEYTAFQPPETAACIFWLKNRQPALWRDKVEERHEHTFNFIGLMPTEEEWRSRFASEKEPLLVIDQRPKDQPESE